MYNQNNQHCTQNHKYTTFNVSNYVADTVFLNSYKIFFLKLY